MTAPWWSWSLAIFLLLTLILLCAADVLRWSAP